MRKKVQQEYNHVIELLDEENERYMSSLVSSLITSVNKKEQSMESVYYAEQQHNMFQVTFTCLKIYCACVLTNKVSEDYNDVIKKSIDTIVSYIEQIVFYDRTDPEFQKDTYDLLCFFCYDYKDLIKPFLNIKTSLFKRQQKKFAPDVVFLTTGVIDCLIENNYLETASSVLKRFFLQSQSYSTKDQHVELLLTIASRYSELLPETLYEILIKNKQYFSNIDIEVEGEYYWILASVSSRLDLNESAYYFKRCYEDRLQVSGANSGYTAIAELRYIVTSTDFSSDTKSVRDFCLEFVRNVENKRYEDISSDAIAFFEGEALYVYLCDDPEIKSKEDYEYCVRLFEKICNMPMDLKASYLTPRMANIIHGQMLFRFGDYIGAESYYLKALENEHIDRSSRVVSDAQLKMNLLATYCAQCDFNKINPLMNTLLEMSRKEQENGLKKSDVWNILLMRSFVENYNIEDDVKYLDFLLETIREECILFIKENAILQDKEKNWDAFIISGIFLLNEKSRLSSNDYQLFYDVLYIIYKDTKKNGYALRNSTSLYGALLLMSIQLGLSDSGLYAKELIDVSYQSETNSTQKVSSLLILAVYYADINRTEVVKRLLHDARTQIEIIWHDSVRYLNDRRLIGFLYNAQIQYNFIYAVERNLLNVSECYNNLLNFKALASLAGRTRNNILNSGSFDTALLQRIHEKQNHLAVLESRFQNIGKEEVKTAYDEMRILEAEFSAQFTKDLNFKAISLDKIVHEMPDDVVVVEYFLTYQYNLDSFFIRNNPKNLCVDIYILRKKCGKVNLWKKVCDNGWKILESAGRFVDLYISRSCGSTDSEQYLSINPLKNYLYNSLIAPVEQYLEGIKTVYIAPDSSFTNLPFGLLQKRGENLLRDQYRIVIIECARDFIFSNYELNSSMGKAMIMGDPKYDMRESLEEDISHKYEQIKLTPLPFSGIEAKQISTVIESDCYLGEEASKNNLLLCANKYRHIHLATHGSSNYDDNHDTLYSSCLYLAGATNWINDGITYPSIGNGILSADEISRGDWKDVSLVVLSSCFNGLNDTHLNKSFYGMISALSAAGVKYVISSIWSQDDMSNAVLMKEFYRQYKKGMMPFEALSFAQAYLKNVTIRDLKEEGWFDSDDPRVADILDEYIQMEETIKPFENEIYWGGFECFLCN